MTQAGARSSAGASARPSAGASARPYHHGNLAQALVDAGLEMAADGGPDAVVLREVARRVGVSPTAAYRHFAGQAALMDAITEAAMGRLAEFMREALADYDRAQSTSSSGSRGSGGSSDGYDGGSGAADGAAGAGTDRGVARGAAAEARGATSPGRVALPWVEPGSAQERALRRLEAIGRAYFDFALQQPGLFRCFCTSLPLPGAGAGAGAAAAGAAAEVGGAAARQADAGEAASSLAGAGSVADGAPGEAGGGADMLPSDVAFGVLTDVLEELAAAQLLDTERVTADVGIALWAPIHGLAVLCLDGPLADADDATRQHMLDVVMDVLVHGVIPRDGR